MDLIGLLWLEHPILLIDVSGSLKGIEERVASFQGAAAMAQREMGRADLSRPRICFQSPGKWVTVVGSELFVPRRV